MLTKYSVKRPFTIFVGVVIAIVFGVVALYSMTPDLMPNISAPYSIVMTTQPGANAEEIEKEILDIVHSYPDVSDPHNLHTRRIGNQIAIEFHIRMDGEISLLKAHSRTHFIDKALQERFGPQTHITIHVEPGKPFEKTTE